MYRYTIVWINLDMKFFCDTYQTATTTQMSTMTPTIPPTTAPHGKELPGCFAPTETKHCKCQSEVSKNFKKLLFDAISWKHLYQMQRCCASLIFADMVWN